MTRVMVVGGAGVFGSRLVDGLAAATDACIIIAGHNRARCEAGIVVERFGPFSFDLSVEAAADGLTLGIVGRRLGKLRLPRWLAPKSIAVESADADGQFCFNVPIALPLIGLLVRYRGSMTLAH
jgi:hypothetical protein